MTKQQPNDKYIFPLCKRYTYIVERWWDNLQRVRDVAERLQGCAREMYGNGGICTEKVRGLYELGEDVQENFTRDVWEIIWTYARCEK